MATPSNEELGQLFANYKRVREDLTTRNFNIVEGLIQLQSVPEYLTDLMRVPESNISSMPDLDRAGMLVQEIRQFQELVRRKSDLERELSDAGYREHILPTPMTNWAVSISDGGK